MSRPGPKFERISLAELKARLPLEERRKLGLEKDAEVEAVNGSRFPRPKNQPGVNGSKRKDESKKSG